MEHLNVSRMEHLNVSRDRGMKSPSDNDEMDIYGVGAILQGDGGSSGGRGSTWNYSVLLGSRWRTAQKYGSPRGEYRGPNAGGS